MPDREKGQILYLVIPCYNEGAVLPQTADELQHVMSSMQEEGLISDKSRIVFVDDGSRDGSWKWMKQKAEEDAMFAALSLSHNAGHQNALYAGLMAVKDSCHMTISLDADLQDDPALIPAMVEQFYKGNEIVYAVRSERQGEGMLKKVTASLFYRLMKALGAELPMECGDFRLLGRQALEYLSLYREDRPFLRGLVPLLGLPSAYLHFDRKPRRAGKSKYSPGKMVHFALDGICALSTKPMSLLLMMGIGIFGCAALWLCIHLPQTAGAETIIATIWASCGLILTALGILGQYIGRIWQSELNRPRYLIREKCNIGEPEKGSGTEH